MLENDVAKIGYGTAYERVLLRRLLKKIIERYGANSILEFPSNDLLGDPYILYMGLGVLVERAKKYSPRIGKFDLVWNFCELERNPDPYKLIVQMSKLGNKYIFLVGQNVFNLGLALHKLYHLLSKSFWDHGDPKYMRLRYARELAKMVKMKILEHGYFDAPIFVIDLYECGLIFRRIVSKRVMCKDMLLRKSPFEELPSLLKPFFSHHWYLLCEL